MNPEEKFSVQVKKIADEVQALARRVSDLVRQVETLDQDREILEQIQRSITSLEEATRLNREHINTILKAIKIDIQTQGARAEKQMEGVKDKVEEHVGNLVESIEKKKVVIVKQTLLEKLKNIFKKGGEKE